MTFISTILICLVFRTAMIALLLMSVIIITMMGWIRCAIRIVLMDTMEILCRGVVLPRAQVPTMWRERSVFNIVPVLLWPISPPENVYLLVPLATSKIP